MAVSPPTSPPSLWAIQDLFCLFGPSPYMSTVGREPSPQSFPDIPPPGSAARPSPVCQPKPSSTPLGSQTQQNDWKSCLHSLKGEESSSNSGESRKRAFSDLQGQPKCFQQQSILKLTRCLQWLRQFHSASPRSQASCFEALSQILPLEGNGSGFRRPAVPELAEIDRIFGFQLVARPPVRGPFLTFVDSSPLLSTSSSVSVGVEKEFSSLGWLEYCSWRRASLPPFNLRAEGWILPSFVDDPLSTLNPGDLSAAFDQKLSRDQSKRIRCLPSRSQSTQDGLPSCEVWEKWCSQLMSDTGGKGVDLVLARNGSDYGRFDSQDLKPESRARVYVRQLATALCCLNRERGSFICRLPISELFFQHPKSLPGSAAADGNMEPDTPPAQSGMVGGSPFQLNAWPLLWFVSQAFSDVRVQFMDPVPFESLVVVGRGLRPNYFLSPKSGELEHLEGLVHRLLDSSLPAVVLGDAVFWKDIDSFLDAGAPKFLQSLVHLCVRTAQVYQRSSPSDDSWTSVEEVIGRYLIPRKEGNIHHLAKSVWFLADNTQP